MLIYSSIICFELGKKSKSPSLVSSVSENSVKQGKVELTPTDFEFCHFVECGIWVVDGDALF